MRHAVAARGRRGQTGARSVIEIEEEVVGTVASLIDERHIRLRRRWTNQVEREEMVIQRLRGLEANHAEVADLSDSSRDGDRRGERRAESGKRLGQISREVIDTARRGAVGLTEAARLLASTRSCYGNGAADIRIGRRAGREFGVK